MISDAVDDRTSFSSVGIGENGTIKMFEAGEIRLQRKKITKMS